MPFGKFFRKEKSHSEPSSPSASLSSKEKRSLFGLKVVQAQQNPEPIYDLSSCSAPFLPNDTYTFCRILGKTTLIIKDNCLTSLESGGSLQDLSELKVLDASYNKIEKLGQINFLKNLRILNLAHNKLKSLPDTFGALRCLQELNLSSNRFSKVPPVICALPRLRVLSLKDNNINTLPKEICGLHQTLCVLELNYEQIDLPQNIISSGLEEIMKYFCEQQGVEYKGSVTTPGSDDIDNIPQIQEYKAESPVNDIMLEYMRKKQEQLRAQMCVEENMRAKEKEQLESVLFFNSKSKDELLLEISSSPFKLDEYEEKKQEKLLGQLKLEEKFRNEQDEQLDQYLTSSSNKESLLLDISAQEDVFQHEVESIVAAKELERFRLLSDLSKAEHETDSALQEILNLTQAQKSSDFVNLIKEQDEEMQKVLSGIVEVNSELRRADVLKAMQNSLLENVYAEAQRDKIEKKQKSWVASLVEEGICEQDHIENLISNRVSAQESVLAAVLQEEAYQAEAFKLLLLKMDLKRNSVIRQIALVEYELTRLSSLELRKKRCGVQYGSTTMLEKRRTLVDLLKSLLQVKEKRDNELETWISQLSQQKAPELTSEDFWLLQYQRLMTMKPTSLAEAEEHLDSEVQRVLSMASALDLIPLFAAKKVTFSELLDMSEKDFESVGIGSATFHSIQRALHSYLISKKVGSEENPSAPTAPSLEGDSSALEDQDSRASAPPLDLLEERASAPPLEAQFVETECVVCLNSDCRVLFMPCGHVCVCAECCQTLKSCPLCRSSITERFFINAQ